MHLTAEEEASHLTTTNKGNTPADGVTFGSAVSGGCKATELNVKFDNQPHVALTIMGWI